MVSDAIINVNGDSVQTLEILFMLTMLSLLPTILVMTTCFTRYVISFSFLRTAMGTAAVPPNTVLISMAVILTLFTMRPTIEDIEQTAYTPYVNGLIGQEEFLDRATVPLKEFMLDQLEVEALSIFCQLSGEELPTTREGQLALPLLVVVSAFVASELKQAFFIGFCLYIPFMLVDMVVACTLMSMGMIMLPPSLISMPFKLLLFISIDGWNLMFTSLVRGIS
ncbi:MAG: flagellar type III secretion system pore protein FliP [Eubacteriales bacterium]